MPPVFQLNSQFQRRSSSAVFSRHLPPVYCNVRRSTILGICAAQFVKVVARRKNDGSLPFSRRTVGRNNRRTVPSVLCHRSGCSHTELAAERGTRLLFPECFEVLQDPDNFGEYTTSAER